MNKPSDGVLVAVDVGTSGARASAFTTDGTELAQVRRSYPTALPGEGRAEQDARRWQTAALSALTSLVKDLNKEIAAIGLTGQCPSVVPLDHKNQPLRPSIIYRDNRATAEATQ
ncbi:MAG TPA: FGGY family carbohydrate kinase, partial [Streptosporangiaceae bacterium]|nr:FGGY family carbohydrate kinase [Streptosporangiaceae bacterium]